MLALAEFSGYYMVVPCADGYDHELLVSTILGLYTGKTQRAYSAVCGLVVRPETSSTRAGVRCLDCRRIRAALTPELVWWADRRCRCWPCSTSLTAQLGSGLNGG